MPLVVRQPPDRSERDGVVISLDGMFLDYHW
jgi:hypothetical protein